MTLLRGDALALIKLPLLLMLVLGDMGLGEFCVSNDEMTFGFGFGLELGISMGIEAEGFKVEVEDEATVLVYVLTGFILVAL